MTKIKFNESYTKLGNSFFTYDDDSNLKFLIVERKKTTPTKTQFFILAKEKGKTNYISSLYPTDKENTFRADYNGIKYIVTIDTNTVTFKEPKND